MPTLARSTPSYVGGPLDVVFVLRNVATGRYHMAYFKEYPMPGPSAAVAELEVVRLKYDMHHTVGAATFEGALAHMDEFVAHKMYIVEGNAYHAAAVEWDGERGAIFIGKNWRQAGAEKPFDPTKMSMNLGTVMLSPRPTGLGDAVPTLRIGVVGYSAQKFDEVEARRLIKDAYDRFEERYPNTTLVVVAGLTNFGIPRLAYEEAARRGWKTVGVTLRYRLERGDPLFQVDERIIVDGQRGDESPAFLDAFDALIGIGGGEQSRVEIEATRRSGREVQLYDLPALSI